MVKFVVVTTVDHRGFASVNYAVSSKNGSKACNVAVVGAERSIQLSYDRLCMKNAVTAYFNLVKWSISNSGQFVV